MKVRTRVTLPLNIPILTTSMAFALLVEDISSFEIEVCHMPTLQPKKSLLILN